MSTSYAYDGHLTIPTGMIPAATQVARDHLVYVEHALCPEDDDLPLAQMLADMLSHDHMADGAITVSPESTTFRFYGEAVLDGSHETALTVMAPYSVGRFDCDDGCGSKWVFAVGCGRFREIDGLVVYPGLDERDLDISTIPTAPETGVAS